MYMLMCWRHLFLPPGLSLMLLCAFGNADAFRFLSLSCQALRRLCAHLNPLPVQQPPPSQLQAGTSTAPPRRTAQPQPSRAGTGTVPSGATAQPGASWQERAPSLKTNAEFAESARRGDEAMATEVASRNHPMTSSVPPYALVMMR